MRDPRQLGTVEVAALRLPQSREPKRGAQSLRGHFSLYFGGEWHHRRAGCAG
jgi:hypothetical protein